MTLTFSDYYFVLFPGLLAVFHLLQRWASQYCGMVIAGASVAFLALADIRSCLILLTIVVCVFALLKRIPLASRPWPYRLAGITISLVPLLYYKLTLNQPNVLTGLAATDSAYNGIIPLGLAFYSLQQISALFDCSKPQYSALRFQEYLLYSFFFVNLPSGPILTLAAANTQFQQFGRQPVSLDKTHLGVSLFIAGFTKMAIVADPIDQSVSALFEMLEKWPSTQLSLTEAVFLAWGSMLQFYFEFSAYSDMAIGMALCFGISLPANFDSPLKARTAMEYINAWHMSFMSFVRSYVFQPVFMRVKRIPLRTMESRHITAWTCAVFLTFFATGAWHAPNPSAILFSLFAAMLLVAFSLVPFLLRKRQSTPAISYLMQAGSRVLLLLGIVITGLYFKAPNNELAGLAMHNLWSTQYISLDERLAFLGSSVQTHWIQFTGFFPNLVNKAPQLDQRIFMNPGYAVLHLTLASIIVLWLPNTMQIFGLLKGSKRSLFQFHWQDSPRYAVLLGVVFAIALGLFNTTAAGFIYGQ